MTTLRNDKLFSELQASPQWETLWTDRDGHYPTTKIWIPTLRGGLDRITVTKKYVTFHDIGCNGLGNSFRIGKEVSNDSND